MIKVKECKQKDEKINHQKLKSNTHQMRLFIFSFSSLILIHGFVLGRIQRYNSEIDVLNSILPPDGSVIESMMIPRYANSPGVKTVRQFITSYFANHMPNWHIERDNFTSFDTPIGPIEFENLVFTQNVRAKRKIILAAHYDSKYSLNERSGASPDGFLGATDSAWPCALLLYLARMIDSSINIANSKDITFQVVFFDGEESIRNWTGRDSLYGSRRLAQLWKDNKQVPSGTVDAPPFNLEDIQLFILFDLLGK